MKFRTLIEKSSIDKESIHSFDQYKEVEIKGITDNSAEVQEGFIFIAVKGYAVDGHEYIDEALEKGASIIMGERSYDERPQAYVQVEDSRKLVGQLAAAYYDFPAKKKVVIGVTGTNGKTTTSLFMRYLLQSAGYTVSYFGTVFNEINGERMKSSLTTPNACTLQKALYESEDEYVVVEVSSQGLEQHRMEGMTFDYALFMNLQHDHLDYHKTIDSYFLAKKQLFNLLKEEEKAIVYTDDSWGKKLFTLLQQEEKNVLAVGSEEEAFVQIDDLHVTEGQITVKGQSHAVLSPLPGSYNVVNTIMAETILHDLGHSFEQMKEWMKDSEPVPGRFERYKLTDSVQAIVDYAHTPEALEVLLQTVKELYPNYRLVNLFGFRGKRDTSKREEMVSASLRYSDQTVLTLDDLNGVLEEEMRKEYESYLREGLFVNMDRTRAIQSVVEEASEPTVIVVTGKGHESYQQAFALGTQSDKETMEYLSH